MAAVIGGVRTASMSVEDDAHRTYKIAYLIKPAAGDFLYDIYTASGLPAIGALIGLGNSTDGYAFRHPETEISVHEEKEGAAEIYKAVLTFSTKPIPRCAVSQFTTPVAEPPKISVSYTKYTEQATYDKDGNPLVNSSLQFIPPPYSERDSSRCSVVIQMNIPNIPLPLAAFSAMIDTVNQNTLWGMAPRTIKLSNIKAERKIYTLCTYYYDITYEFDVDYETWDRTVPDLGTQILAPGGTLTNPKDYVAYTDNTGQPAQVHLDGSGHPWDGTGPEPQITMKFYAESDFTTLPACAGGFPTSL